MRRVVRKLLTTVLAVAVFTAGTAAAGVDLKKVVLKPGHCINVAKLHICAAKAKPKIITRTETVTSHVVLTSPPVTATVTSPPLTVTSPPVTVTTAATTITVTNTVTTTPTPQIAFVDGTYRVGVDIVAGTYRSTANTNDCYWERLKGFSGTLDDIIANFFGISPTIVTISPSDVGFRSSRCGGWAKIG